MAAASVLPIWPRGVDGENHVRLVEATGIESGPSGPSGPAGLVLPGGSRWPWFDPTAEARADARARRTHHADDAA
jgi:hypothetical protein